MEEYLCKDADELVLKAKKWLYLVPPECRNNVVVLPADDPFKRQIGFILVLTDQKHLNLICPTLFLLLKIEDIGYLPKENNTRLIFMNGLVKQWVKYHVINNASTDKPLIKNEENETTNPEKSYRFLDLE